MCMLLEQVLQMLLFISKTIIVLNDKKKYKENYNH